MNQLHIVALLVGILLGVLAAALLLLTVWGA